MKVLLFSGFLASGKTTLIRSFIQCIQDHGMGLVAVIENEVGAIGIDDLLIKESGVTVKPISGGCVCCQVTGSLIKALDEINATVAPEWLIIELTGVAKLADLKIMLQKYSTALKEGNTLMAFTIIDANRWEKLSVRAEHLLRPQAEASDILVVNKIDLCENPEEKRSAISRFFWNGSDFSCIGTRRG
jgi:G3E family GTPase